MNSTTIGSVCLWVLAFVFVVYGQHYVNVAPGKKYRQRGRHPAQDGPSSVAADGNTSIEDSSINCVVPTGTNPWWEVNLGTVYPVYNITIWTNHGRYLDGSVFTVDGQWCASIRANWGNNMINVTCVSVMYGQIVRISKPWDSWIWLCEMQIWVCEDGWYGNQCSKASSPGCQNTSCDRHTGHCSPCKTRYTVDTCPECQDGYYNTTSNGTCIRCNSYCQENSCDPQTGKCHRCVDGWYRDQCSKACSPGCVYTSCDRQSGHCSPCKAHYTGDNCSVCEDGWYGDQCSTACSPGCQDTACDQQTGHCSPCKARYTSDTCSVCEDGWYGDQCSTACSPGCRDTACNQHSGGCYRCKAHYMGSRCSVCQDEYYKTSNGTCISCNCNCQAHSCDPDTGSCHGCVDGWYGDQCSKACSPGCRDAACDQQTGRCCPCKDRYTGDTCSVCEDGWYGDQCSTACSPGCQDTACDHSSGGCYPCTAPYTGATCSDCQDGYYKTTSNGTCIGFNSNCQENSCDPQTGKASKAESKFDMISTPFLIGSILGAGLLIGLCVIVLGVVIWKLRYLRVPREKTNAKGGEQEALSPQTDLGKPTAEFWGEPCQLAENEVMTSDPAKLYGQLTGYYNNTGDVHVLNP